MIRVEMLPAAHGDCLWVEWTEGAEVFRMLIDGGPAATYPRLLERVMQLPIQERVFELLVITHIDADHIEGIVRLLLDADRLNIRFKRVWFNGREQLDQLPGRIGDDLGAVSGEYLTLLLNEMQTNVATPIWNGDFAEGIVRCDASADELPTIGLPGGLELTILSPDLERLHDLDDRWERELAKARLTPGRSSDLRRRLHDDRRLRPLADELGTGIDHFDDEDLTSDLDDAALFEDELGGGDGADRQFGDDSSPANGSSIAFLAEWADGSSVLFAGDAFAAVLQRSLERLLAARGATRLELDAFKIPHHGSVGNISKELLQLLRCKTYLISTNGAIFNHPHQRCVELLVENHNARGRPRLHFNYRSEFVAQFESGVIDGVDCVVHYPTGTTITI